MLDMVAGRVHEKSCRVLPNVIGASPKSGKEKGPKA
jgi:hypothetical protein